MKLIVDHYMLGVILSDMDDKKPEVEELTDEEKREILEKNGAGMEGISVESGGWHFEEVSP